jgi:hypothetical protein
VFAWGDNSAKMPPNLSNTVAIAAGMFLDIALTSDGKVVTEASDHQKLNVPGPVTVVCKMEVWEGRYRVLLLAADMPS